MEEIAPMSTKEKEQRVIELLSQIKELAADAGDAFYDIAGKDLSRWDDIRGFISSIKLTLDIVLESHAEGGLPLFAPVLVYPRLPFSS
jgi:hypothetical protein